LAGVLAKLEGKVGRENGRGRGFGRMKGRFDRGLIGSGRGRGGNRLGWVRRSCEVRPKRDPDVWDCGILMVPG
jgi:hypothetical protein